MSKDNKPRNDEYDLNEVVSVFFYCELTHLQILPTLKTIYVLFMLIKVDVTKDDESKQDEVSLVNCFLLFGSSIDIEY